MKKISFEQTDSCGPAIKIKISVDVDLTFWIWEIPFVIMASRVDTLQDINWINQEYYNYLWLFPAN